MSGESNTRAIEALLPPFRTNEAGDPRRVGIELELSGLELDQITELVTDVLGGTVDKKSPYEATVLNSSLGDIRVEFDATLFREMKVRHFFSEIDPEIITEVERDNIEKALASIAGWLVPYELVFPPLAIERLPELEVLRARLGERAQGTGSSVINAFGLHLNPEIPELSIKMVLNYLRAFLILYEELRQVHDIDPIRSLSGYISPFDRRYAMLVLNEKYQPSTEQFIDDYLQANPSRNRPLDLLPLLTQMDEERIRRRLPEEKISKRPAFHYRMPNSLVDETDWSISREWSTWMRVERLAADQHSLAKRCRYELKRLQGPFFYWLRRLWRTKPLLSRKPMIAVTGPDKGGFPAWFCTRIAVLRAGGYPIRLTPSMFRDDPSLPPFDGLILGGGADVDPERYGEELQLILDDDDSPPTSTLTRRIVSRILAPVLFIWRTLFSLTASGVDKDRDDFEQSCLERALREQLPVLGICRGAQFLNIHFGGTLTDDLSGFYGEVSQVATLLPKNRVELDPRSYLCSILGLAKLGVNSLHKQAVDEIGQGLRVSARDQAGIVQAIEVDDKPYIMGVQWHPEYLPASRLQQRLFLALVQEALSRKR
jgi:gamma-glutamyl-gamma-aminobutyrate hydrolase PuuD